MQKWRFIDSEKASAQWNMAVDESLLYSFKEGDMPIFRLYRWEEPSLSFGRFSKPKETIDWDKIQREKLPYVRRMTGGGILVHGRDISYALIVPRSFIKEHGVKKSYKALCAFLIRLYDNLGIEAAFAHDLHVPPSQSAVCLAGTEAYDIMTGGRKIGGNAQRHTHNAMLQHGSIPLAFDHERFDRLFLEDSGLSRSAALREMQNSLTEVTLKEEIIRAFGETFDTVLVNEPLRTEEEALAQKLFHEKYAQEAWNVHAKTNL